MNKLLKVTVSLTLVVLFLIACVISLVLLFFSAWLHTYNALTKETVVAEVLMHPIQKDDKGEYIQIEFTPFSQQSALTTTINPDVAPTDAAGTTQTYKLYGDTVNIGGPVVKFHNELILINFETIYKLARIQGVYNANSDKERNRTVFSIIDLNGGFDQTWWSINDNEDRWPYNMFVDRVQFSVPGEPGFKSGDLKRYEIVVTKDGFAWNLVERISK
jgi:hypothetical protein